MDILLTIARIIEHVRLIDTAAPNTDHILPTITCECKPLPVSIVRDRCEEVVGWDPVRA
jgi:hypothetical protein